MKNIFSRAVILLSLSIFIFFVINNQEANAADIWKTKDYPGGKIVSHKGKCYQAKWWASSKQAPDQNVKNDWETPWKAVSGNCSGSKSNTGNNKAPKPAPVKKTPVKKAPVKSNPVKKAPVKNQSSQSSGATNYVNKTYKGGSFVLYNGTCYKAKWYANVGQSPAKKTANAWETPWSKTSKESCNNSGSSNSTNSSNSNKKGASTTRPTTKPTPTKPTNPVVTPPKKPVSNTKFPYSDAQIKAKGKAIQAKENNLSAILKSIETRSNSVVNAIRPKASSNPSNVKRIEGIMNESSWNYLFARRNKSYSYLNFLKAAAKFPSLCKSYSDGRNSDQICRKTLATMFAHFAQETGGHAPGWAEPEWRQGLYYLREVGWTETQRGGYNGECGPTLWQGQTWPCGKFSNGEYKSYFGRGAKQLSYNYNYGPFSYAIYGTVRTLLDKPELVADTWLNLASAIFFYLYPQPPKPSMLHVIDGTWKPNQHDRANGLVPGFGVTIQIINGGVECGGTDDLAQGKNRIKYYKEFAKYFKINVPSNEVLGCARMKRFDTSGSGATNIYWEQNWDYVSTNPGGKSYACKLVGYQTRFSAFKEDDYLNCVKFFFK